MNRLVPIVGLVLRVAGPRQGGAPRDRGGARSSAGDGERGGLRGPQRQRQAETRASAACAGVSVTDGVSIGRDRLGRAVPTRGGRGAQDHRPGVHHQAGGLRRADRPVQDPAVLPRPGAARGRRRGGRRLRAAPRPERAQRRLHVRQRRRPAPQREHGRSRCARSPRPRRSSPSSRSRGDLTDNATDAEFMQYKTGTTASKLPVWPAVGNHEYFNAGPSTYEARIDNYRRHVGPEWYSFDHGKRHFLVLENNGAAPIEEQREWIEADLEAHARGKRVVVLMHMPMNVPFGSPSAYDDYAGLLEQYETELVLVGHEHSNDVDDSTWVKGARHIQTNSSSYTIDHSPRGFRYVTMKGPRFSNPFRMYGVEPLARRHQPGARRGADRPRRGPGQRLPHVRARQGRALPARRPRPLAQPRSRRATSPGTADIDDDRGSHDDRGRGGRRERRALERDLDVHGPPRPGAEDRAGRRLGAVPRRRSSTAACRRRARTRSAAGVDAPHARRVPTGSPVIADGVAYAACATRTAPNAAACTPSNSDSGRKLWEFDVAVVGPRHARRCPAARCSSRRSAGRCTRSAPAPAGCAWKREPEPGTPPVNQRSYSYYSPAVADGHGLLARTRPATARRAAACCPRSTPRTGAVKWESPMTGATMSDGTPAVADGRVYVGNETADRVIAYDAATGAQLWTATARLGGWQDASPTAVGGRVFIGSNNRVIARDAATGADLWQHQSPDASWIPQNATPSAPAVAGNTLYMGFPNGRVTALDVASGAVVWSVRLPGPAVPRRRPLTTRGERRHRVRGRQQRPPLRPRPRHRRGEVEVRDRLVGRLRTGDLGQRAPGWSVGREPLRSGSQQDANFPPSRRVYTFIRPPAGSRPRKGHRLMVHTRRILALPTAVFVAALIAAPSFAATPVSGASVSTQPTVAPAPETQGIIMSDGRICNPRWGC